MKPAVILIFTLIINICLISCKVQKPVAVPTSKYYGTLKFNSSEIKFEISSAELIVEIDKIIDQQLVKSSRSERNFTIATIEMNRVLTNQDTLCYDINYCEDKFAYIYFYNCNNGWIKGKNSSWDLARFFENYFSEQGISISK